MPILGSELERALITSLSEAPFCTVQYLRTRLAACHKAVSKQVIYKKLAEFEREGIVVKSGDRYALRLTWISECSAFLENCYEAYLSTPLELLLPKEGERRKWTFRDMLRMDLFHTQLILTIHRVTGSKRMYTWVPRPWYFLSHAEREVEFWKANKRDGNETYLILGGHGFLEQRYVKYLQEGDVHYSMALGPFESERRKSFNVIGDFIVTSSLSPTRTKIIEEVFERTKSLKDLTTQDILPIFTTPTSISLSVEFNRIKARKLSKLFTDYFGIEP